MASRSLNRVILIGNLTRDPELKYTPNGTAVCTFGVATNRSWTTSDGQTKEEAQYHRIVSWQKLAELCGKLLTKGRKVFLEGRLTYRTFTGRDGQQRSVTEIVLDDFIVFGDGKRVSAADEIKAEGAGKHEENVSVEEIPQASGEGTVTAAPVEAMVAKSKDESVNPDDIPF
jgi:single-strand DNA-binding protein